MISHINGPTKVQPCTVILIVILIKYKLITLSTLITDE